MPNPKPRRATKRAYRSSDHQLRAFSDPTYQTDMLALADALRLHTAQAQADAEHRPAGLLAGVQKLTGFRPELAMENTEAPNA